MVSPRYSAGKCSVYWRMARRFAARKPDVTSVSGVCAAREIVEASSSMAQRRGPDAL